MPLPLLAALSLALSPALSGAAAPPLDSLAHAYLAIVKTLPAGNAAGDSLVSVPTDSFAGLAPGFSARVAAWSRDSALAAAACRGEKARRGCYVRNAGRRIPSSLPGPAEARALLEKFHPGAAVHYAETLELRNRHVTLLLYAPAAWRKGAPQKESDFRLKGWLLLGGEPVEVAGLSFWMPNDTGGPEAIEGLQCREPKEYRLAPGMRRPVVIAQYCAHGPEAFFAYLILDDTNLERPFAGKAAWSFSDDAAQSHVLFVPNADSSFPGGLSAYRNDGRTVLAGDTALPRRKPPPPECDTCAARVERTFRALWEGGRLVYRFGKPR
jgi:hypothetical protein